jgi:hypothetical protein
MPSEHQVSLRVDPQRPLHPIVVVGDADLSDLIHGYRLEQTPGNTARLLLWPSAHGGASFHGLATVQLVDDADPAEAVGRFLAGVDPAKLEAEALNRDDLLDPTGGQGSVTRAVIALLAEKAAAL